MAPPPPTIPNDRDAFLDDVAAYYEQRGVPWEREPKVSGRPIDLHKLFNLVMQHGGYDVLSAERMKWRQVVTKHFGFGNQHEAAMTFQLKTTYYKNLAAYEIAKVWGEEPPPYEILEAVTAKGADLRSRTLETYRPAAHRDSGVGAEGMASGEEEVGTPKAETMDVDDPGSASRYPSRQLRHDPKRTQVYQPDNVASRPRFARTTASPQASPAPFQPYNSMSADPRNAAFSLDRYEPRQPMALTLRQVITPGNNPEAFRQRQAMAKAQVMPRPPPPPQHFLKQCIPNGMTAPNIYIRCLYGLRSGIPMEQDFALHHLVKVSYERGDKYKFEGFPHLAEALLEKLLEITQLVYNKKWDISYDQDEAERATTTLNGAFGTPGLRERLNFLQLTANADEPQPAEFSHQMEKLNEAALVVRNMVILEENAHFVSQLPLFKDWLIIALNLPAVPQLVEYQHYALEIAEHVTRFWELPEGDPLSKTLLEKLASNDRGTILAAMPAIIRIGMDRPSTHKLTDVEMSTVERLIAFLYLEGDDQLMLSALDFLYQYTAIPENTRMMLLTSPTTLPSMVPRLVSLLVHNATPIEEKVLVKPSPVIPKNESIPVVPQEILRQLLSFHEPERSSRWLRCCFEEAPLEDITQIAIWQAYQGRFTQYNAVPAADFIKNVSNTFATAQAQVINGVTPRFIIKGIRPRRVLVDLNGIGWFKCKWAVTSPEIDASGSPVKNDKHLCHTWHASREAVWKHIMADHLGVTHTDDGIFDNRDVGDYVCRWSGCTRASGGFERAAQAGRHVKGHIPTSAAEAERLESQVREAEYAVHIFHQTPVDEKNHPCGIPWQACMVLRNLARFALKNPHAMDKTGEKDVVLMDRFFGHVMSDLWSVASSHRTLRNYVDDLMKMVVQRVGRSDGNAPPT